MVIGIDHGYYAIKGAHISFPTGLTAYDYEPYTMQNVLQYKGRYFVCGSGRQTLLKDKTSNDNYYLLTMAAIAKELSVRKAPKKCSIILAAGIPLASFGREKKPFREYLFRKEQPLCFKYENESYEVQIQDVRLFPQGYSALALHPEWINSEPSILLIDIGGWTVDLMRLDNAVPNASTCRSLELGVIRCIDEIMEQVRRNTGLSVTEIQVERVLNGSACSMGEDVRKLIQKYGRIYTERILSAIAESGFDLKAVPAIIMGGGAAILKRHVRPQDGLCRQIYLTDIHANASGYERIVGQMSATP
ncbi:MAG: ParM/StbA family protein [Hespellia sp.]|nr:ParM/StbA family protein [Hespellia sp.]